MKRFSIITLGCKVNQCESAAIAYLLEKAGHVSHQGSDSPDIVIINTCTVTGKAAMQSRQAIRRTAREFPEATIVVTGCYAQTAVEEINKIKDVDLIIAHQDKMRIHEILTGKGFPAAKIRPYLHKNEPCFFATLPPFIDFKRTRAFLKIQDGCNTRCTYCIVPYARGSSCSMPESEVYHHIRTLGRQGYAEVVLTGIHLGAYGADLSPVSSLTALVKKLTDPPIVKRLRLSSVEPTEVDEDLIDLIDASQGTICRHFHIPLQHGDDTLLHRMGRPYSSQQFAAIVDKIHAKIPHAAIGVDVMAGFPGETQEAFRNTYQLIADLPVTYLHVFPFSPRKGTPAVNFKPKVPERITKERCRALRELGEKKRNDFYRRMIGKKVKMLVETHDDGIAKGLSDNYVPIKIMGGNVPKNGVVKVRIDRIETDNTAIGVLGSRKK